MRAARTLHRLIATAVLLSAGCADDPRPCFAECSSGNRFVRCGGKVIDDCLARGLTCARIGTYEAACLDPLPRGATCYDRQECGDGVCVSRVCHERCQNPGEQGSCPAGERCIGGLCAQLAPRSAACSPTVVCEDPATQCLSVAHHVQVPVSLGLCTQRCSAADLGPRGPCAPGEECFPNPACALERDLPPFQSTPDCEPFVCAREAPLWDGARTPEGAWPRLALCGAGPAVNNAIVTPDIVRMCPIDALCMGPPDPWFSGEIADTRGVCVLPCIDPGALCPDGWSCKVPLPGDAVLFEPQPHETYAACAPSLMGSDCTDTDYPDCSLIGYHYQCSRAVEVCWPDL